MTIHQESLLSSLGCRTKSRCNINDPQIQDCLMKLNSSGEDSSTVGACSKPKSSCEVQDQGGGSFMPVEGYVPLVPLEEGNWQVRQSLMCFFFRTLF